MEPTCHATSGWWLGAWCLAVAGRGHGCRRRRDGVDARRHEIFCPVRGRRCLASSLLRGKQTVALRRPFGLRVPRRVFTVWRSFPAMAGSSFASAGRTGIPSFVQKGPGKGAGRNAKRALRCRWSGRWAFGPSSIRPRPATAGSRPVPMADGIGTAALAPARRLGRFSAFFLVRTTVYWYHCISSKVQSAKCATLLCEQLFVFSGRTSALFSLSVFSLPNHLFEVHPCMCGLATRTVTYIIDRGYNFHPLLRDPSGRPAKVCRACCIAFWTRPPHALHRAWTRNMMNLLA